MEEKCIVCREITVDSPEYERVLDLRNRVLRESLGRNIRDEDLSRERDYRHFGAFCGDRIVGTVQFRRESARHFHLRQFAVEPTRQGEGIGRKILRFAEHSIASEFPVKITLHARNTAIVFYKKCGYHTAGESFEEIGLPHTAMEKMVDGVDR